MQWSKYMLMLLCISTNISVNAQADADVETIRKRLQHDLFKPVIDTMKINAWLTSQSADGSWPEINYTDTSRTGFQHRVHLERMVALTRAFRKKGSPLEGHEPVRKAASKALDHWLDHDWRSANWWWNEIGTPDYMIQTLLLFDDELSPTQRYKGLRIAGRASLDSGFGARPGGDLIKIAGLLGKQGLFTRNKAIVERVIKVMAGEIHVTEERGLKPDMSFHHRHDKVISTLSYGLAYPANFSYWGRLIRGTRFQFPDSATQLVVDFFLDGICKSMAFARIPDIAAKNRDLSRPGELSPFHDDMARQLLAITDYRRKELEMVAEIQKGRMKPNLSWNKYFPYSEYATHQRPFWFASVRMHSSRQEQNVESPHNEEGLRMHHLADGACYVQVTGKEYFDLAPVWDWQKIPGTTVLQKPEHPHWKGITKKGKSAFVGAVSDGHVGAVAMHLKSVHDPLEAKKAWFFFEDEYVCLGTDIQAASNLPVATSIEQSLLQGPVTAFTDGKMKTIPRGRHQIINPEWIAHGNIMYIFPEPCKVELENQAKYGSWRAVSNQDWATKDSIQKDVLSLWFEGEARSGNKYAYIISPFMEPIDELIDKKNSRPTGTVNIIQNDGKVQAVGHQGLGIVQAVFHTAGAIVWNGKNIRVDKPCMLMLQIKKGNSLAEVFVSDPLRKSSTIMIEVGDQKFEINFPTGTKSGDTARMLAQ